MKYKYKKLDYKTEDLESLSNSDLKKLGDYWLRQFLLKREGNHSYIFCPLKNKNYPVENMEVAHFIDRGIMNTRYDLCNCHLVSKASNSFDAQVQKEGYKSLHHKEYSEWIVKKYGEGILEILREKAISTETFRKENYIEAINKFRNND